MRVAVNGACELASNDRFRLLKIAQSRVMDTYCMLLALECTEVNIVPTLFDHRER
jgi:hypothetical protein